MNKKEKEDFINEVVKSVMQKLLLREMADSREQFKNNISGFLTGGMKEFLKSRCAKKNGFIEWVEHWHNEADRLINYELFELLLLGRIKGDQSKQKAFKEVSVHHQKYQRKLIPKIENIIKKDYKVEKLKFHLDDQDFEAFWQMVDEMTFSVFEE